MSRLPGLARRLVDRLPTSRRRSGEERVRRSSPPTVAVPAGVRIEYSPQLDGDPDPGEVVWTWVPYEDDPSMGKDRPVIVIGRRGDRLVAVPLTSKDRRGGDAVPVGTGAWDRDRRPSYAKVDRLLDVDPTEVRREGAILPRGPFDQVVAGVERHHDVAR